MSETTHHDLRAAAERYTKGIYPEPMQGTPVALGMLDDAITLAEWAARILSTMPGTEGLPAGPWTLSKDQYAVVSGDGRKVADTWGGETTTPECDAVADLLIWARSVVEESK